MIKCENDASKNKRVRNKPPGLTDSKLQGLHVYPNNQCKIFRTLSNEGNVQYDNILKSNSSLVIISNTMWLWTKIRSDSDHPKNVVENYIPCNRIAPSLGQIMKRRNTLIKSHKDSEPRRKHPKPKPSAISKRERI